MNKLNAFLHVLFSALVVASLSGCNRNTDPETEIGHHHHHDAEQHHDHNHDHAHNHAHDHGAHADKEDSGDEIVLAPETAKRFGVEATTIHKQPFRSVLKVSGRLIDNPQTSSQASAPVAGIISYAAGIAPGSKVTKGMVIARIDAKSAPNGDTSAEAKAALDAAKRELDRLKPLHDEGVVSTARLNQAQADYDRALAAYSPRAAAKTVVAPMTGVLTELLAPQGALVEAGVPVANVASNAVLTLCANVPQQQYAFVSQVADANVKFPHLSNTINLAENGGKHTVAPSSSATPGYIQVYFTFNAPKDVVIPAGTSAEVFLLGNERQNVISVPVSAIAEQQGAKYVYKKVDDHGYIKLPVTIGQSDGRNYEVLSGISDGDNIVTQGVASVKMAENASVVPEGHSHNH